jgi:hypothetical protein
VRVLELAGRELVYELRLDDYAGMVWVEHSVDRCEFAGLIAANFKSG